MSDKVQSKAVTFALQTADDMEAGRAYSPRQAAESLRYLAAQVEDYQQALAEERTHADGLAKDCDEMVRRLDRLEHHLRHGIVAEVTRKLADYAGGFIDYEAGIAYEDRNNPPPDPFPDPEAPPKAKRRKRKGAA